MSEALKVCCEHLANSQHIIEEKNKEIARLTAEVERHRMTEEESEILALVKEAADAYGDSNVSIAVQAILERTAPKET